MDSRSRKNCQKYRARKGCGWGENSSLTYTYNWSNNFSSLLLSPLPPNFLSFLSFTSLVSLQYIYADLPVGKEVGALCIIFSHFFFFSIFLQRTRSVVPFAPRTRSISLSPLSAVARRLSLPFAPVVIHPQLGSVCAERLSPVAPNSVPKSRFAWISSRP